MADFYNCNSNLSAFDPITLAMALFAEEQNIALAETGQYAFRISEQTADRDTPVIGCADKDGIIELFRQCIHLATDGKPALRVVITDRVTGAALEDVPNCTDAENLELFIRNTFIMTDAGEVAFNFANIT